MTVGVERALAELGSHFRARRDAILVAWREAADADPQLTNASALARAQFEDHIPELLDAFEARLRAERPADDERAEREQRASAAGHGVKRWQQGYQLREVMREWRHLHLLLLDELERWTAARGEAPPEALRFARRALAELCSDGVCESATQYAHLRQAEAATRVRDLQHGLASLAELERRRAEAWREAAHDLRGNLGVVSNATELLHDGGADERMRARFLGILRNGVSSLRELLNDLSALARLEAGHERREVRPFDAAELLRKLCDGMRPLASERGLALDARGPDALHVEGDAVKVQRIVQNLLLNAVKYTHRGGVHVSWGALDGDVPRWELVVRDSGPGLSPGTSEPLARALEQATEGAQPAAVTPPEPPRPGAALGNEPGEGIGLSIVKRLCELLDAVIELETRPGHGARFRVVFPRAYPRPAPSERA